MLNLFTERRCKGGQNSVLRRLEREENMLRLKNISYSVELPEGKKQILSGVDLDFEDGTQTIITGHNGSGKTTLAKIVMGILTPDCGTVELDGEDITGLSITERAQRGVAFAFQQPVRFKGLKVRNLLAAASGREPSRAELCDCLSAVGLCAADYLERELSGELSGGELKRIEIAMALLRSARLYVFDEPEAGIDIWSFDRLVGMFATLKGKAISVLVSHQERIMRGADRLVLLSGGRVERVGAPDEVLKFIHADTACKRLVKEA